MRKNNKHLPFGITDSSQVNNSNTWNPPDVAMGPFQQFVNVLCFQVFVKQLSVSGRWAVCWLCRGTVRCAEYQSPVGCQSHVLQRDKGKDPVIALLDVKRCKYVKQLKIFTTHVFFVWGYVDTICTGAFQLCTLWLLLNVKRNPPPQSSFLTCC